MFCTRIDEGEKTTLVIDGSLDALTVAKFRCVVDGVVKDRRSHVVVNMEKLELMDTSGLGALITLLKRVKSVDATFVVTAEGARDQPLAVLKLKRLDKSFGL